MGEGVGERLVATSKDAIAAVAAHRDAVRRMGELHGLEGATLDEYEAKTEADLTMRLRNAAVSALVPDCHAAPPASTSTPTATP